MTNTQTTKTKIGQYFGLLTVLVAMLAAMLVGSGAALAATATFSNPSPIQIVDNGPAIPYPSQINVQNLSGNITDVNVKLNGFTDDGWPDDVGVLLVGPKGQKTLLMSDVGGNFFPIDPVKHLNSADLTFDDEATNSLPDNTQITAGAYKPTRGTVTDATGDCWLPPDFPSPAPVGPYATNLSAFAGTDPNGTWSLYVLDDCALFTGQFGGGWSLDISTDGTAPQPDPQTDTTAPKVVSTVPAAGATGVSSAANISATFSEDMQALTLNSASFGLFKKGSNVKVSASVSYDATTHRATLDPTGVLKRGTYRAVVTTDAKDLAGNRLDQDPTLTGLQQEVWTFRVQ